MKAQRPLEFCFLNFYFFIKQPTRYILKIFKKLLSISFSKNIDIGTSGLQNPRYSRLVPNKYFKK